MTGYAGPDDLRVERSGGFGGLIVSGRVPLDELSERECAALEESFAAPRAAPPGPDRFVYRLRVGGRETTLQESQVPSDLKPLLRRMISQGTT